VGRVVDTETGLLYETNRYYDPSTGQWLTRDPLDALTQSAYGYVGDNPLNGTDPDGLYWGQSFVHGAESVAGGAARSVRSVVTVGGGLVAVGVGDAIGAGVNFANNHLGASIAVCGYGCIGFEVQNGHLYFNYGLGASFGAGASVNYYSHPLDQWCKGEPTMDVGLGPVGGAVDLANGRDWSAGGGPGIIVGATPMHSIQLL